MNRIFPLLLMMIFLISCDKDDPGIDVDLNKFEQITENYPFDELVPASEDLYWELIFSTYDDEQVVATGGDKCGDAGEEDCVDGFDALVSKDEGFGFGSASMTYFYYLKYQTESENVLVTTYNGLLNFLGEIDSEGDALLLAVANGYSFNTSNKQGGAIRQTKNGYEVLATRLVSACSPVQTNRYHLKITTEGEVIILDEEVLDIMENGCI